MFSDPQDRDLNDLETIKVDHLLSNLDRAV